MNQQINKQGYLQTKAFFWNTYFYYLDSYNFFRFQNHQTHTPCQIYDLKNSKIIGPEENNGTYYFSIQMTDQLIKFRTTSSSEALDWIQKLKMSINLHLPTQLISHQATIQTTICENDNEFNIQSLNMTKEWKFHKQYDKLKLYKYKDNQFNYIKGEWIIQQPIKIVKHIFINENWQRLFQPFLKNIQQIGNQTFQQIFAIKNKSISNFNYIIDYNKQMILENNYLLIQKNVSKSNIQILQLQLNTNNNNQQLMQETNCEIIIQIKQSKNKLDEKFAKEYIINHQIINYEFDHIIRKIEQEKLSKQNIQQENLDENFVNYFQINDRLGYQDTNTDNNHPAIQNQTHYLRFTTLNEEQKIILNQFRERMKDLQLNDNALIRHLQARLFNLDNAEEMLRSVLKWRKQNNINNLDYYSNKYSFFNKAKILFPIGEGKLGYPIFYIRAENLAPDDYVAPKPTLEDFTEYFCALMEHNIRNMKGHIDCQILIIDCYNLSRKNANIEMIKKIMSQVFSNYPERQCKNILINLNWLAKSIYNIVKPFLPQRTLDKMAFAGQNQQEILEVLLKDINIEVIPKQYGGLNEILQ